MSDIHALIGTSLALAILLICGIIHAYRTAPHMDAQPSHLDALDGVGDRCPNCRRQVTGLAWVIVSEHLGGGMDRVCHGCADEGIGHGWFRKSLASDATVLDIATAFDTADLDDIDNLVEQWGRG